MSLFDLGKINVSFFHLYPSHARGEGLSLMFFLNNFCWNKAIEVKFQLIVHY